MFKSLKSNGFRSIIIQDTEYLWRFQEKLEIQSKSSKNSSIVVEFGTHESIIGEGISIEAKYEPTQVSTAFVRSSILEARRLGFDHETPNQEISLIFKNGVFHKK